ncbi:MAG: protein kinase [Deltaproteobacteria bacterium]|nr:protein kinase [Deltaproteobacteria bacterium]
MARGRRLGRYELVAEIASGGMGTVFLARIDGVGGFTRLFAIKVLHPHLAKEEQFISMFLDEARLAARLHHPNAVGIVDVDQSELGYFLVMEYVDGFTLEKLLSRTTGDPEARVRYGLRCLLDAIVGLDAAHRLKDDHGVPLGIVHRDVSPQNVLIGMDGVGRITDFGVARAAARITSSRPGMLKGKPCYMSPEQAKGGELDARADVFALGIMLWEVLTGELLFQAEGGPAVVLMNVVRADIRPPSELNPDIPPALEAVCMKALARPLEERYASGRELAQALEEAALEAKLLASNHALADAMAELFAEDAEARREAIARRMSQMGEDAELPATASDVYQVPKLESSGGAVSATGVVTRASRNKSGPWHESGQTDALESADSSGAAPMHTESARTLPLRLAVGLGVLGLAMLGLAVWLGAHSTPEVAVEPTPEVAVEPTPEVAVEPTPEVAVEPTPEVAVEPTPEVAVEPTPEVALEPTPEVAVEPTPEVRHPRRPRRPAPTAPTVSMTVAPATTAPTDAPPSMAPTLEDNPYLRH